ncbi:potassium channel family protein [Streptomyces sp. P9-2B-2]|uniref:potassium channel family protein n=1 Tax=unclassified Streptomyces TaxID=2593676 RepID=UPI002001E250|nr:MULTISPECIES: potassium channel family protein [Streptomyces]MCX4637861.1 potassium channel family protein [Streptomyces platensis]WJY36016.1 potassium channel family protein [Streptomyces sp. P9-2B-2]
MPSFLVSVLNRLFRNEAWRRLHAQAAIWVTVVMTAVLLAGAALVVVAESGAPHANITSYPKALWWSIETATTVGYGDFYPVTLWGRVIASLVMLSAITAFGVITAALATWFVGHAEQDMVRLGKAVGNHAREDAEALRSELHMLHERFDHVENLIRDK